MLLTDVRRPARTTSAGALIPLAEQDRTGWDQALIAEGVALVTTALYKGTPGVYQLQAAIAAVHDEAAGPAETDWRQIAALYSILQRVDPNPMVSLNRAVAVAMADGPDVGLALLEPLAELLAGHHRLDAVRAHLLEMLGDTEAARTHYLAAAGKTASLAERSYLRSKAATLTKR